MFSKLNDYMEWHFIHHITALATHYISLKPIFFNGHINNTWLSSSQFFDRPLSFERCRLREHSNHRLAALRSSLLVLFLFICMCASFSTKIVTVTNSIRWPHSLVRVMIKLSLQTFIYSRCTKPIYYSSVNSRTECSGERNERERERERKCL